jgi:hypothetical protein
MSGDKEIKAILSAANNRATITDNLHVMVSRAELEKEHSLLIARLHLLRKQLGYQPLLTGKEQRRQK